MLCESFNFSKGIDEYINHIRIRNYAETTQNNYRRMLNFFVKDMEMNAVKNDKDSFNKYFNKFILGFLDDEKSIGYVCLMVIVVRNLFRYMKINYLDDFETIKKPKSIPKPLSEEDLFDLLHSVKYDFEKDTEYRINLGMRDEAILYFFYATGLRVSELCNIMVDDLNFINNSLKVRGKGGKERLVIFDKITSQIVSRYLSKRTTDSIFLFPNTTNGNKLSTRAVEKIVNKYGRKIGLNITPHMLRHTFATHLLAKGMDIRYIQALMGHETIATTQIYTKVDISNIQREYNKIKI